MKKLIFILLLLPTQWLFSQSFEFTGAVGIGNYTMSDLKELNSDYKNSIGLPIELTDDFPLTYNYKGIFSYHRNNYFLGVTFSYASTGSRLSYADYSGSLTLDITCNSYQFGPLVGYNILKKDNFNIDLLLNTPIIFSKVKFNNTFQVYDSKPDKDFTEVNSESIGIIPAINLKYYFKFLYLGFEPSYLIDAKGNLHSSSDTESFLVDDVNNKITTDWSGLRLFLLIGFKIN